MKLSFEGLDEVYREMTRAGESVGPTADRMAEAGAEEVVKGWQEAIQEAGLIRTGAMLRSVRAGKVKDGRTDIYPQGKDAKGTRNAEKAFILHYGTSRKRGTRFVDRAEEIAEPRAVEAMTRIWEESK